MNRAIFFVFSACAAVASPAAAQQRIDATTFTRLATGSDLFEIQSSQLALQRSSNPRLRAFAQQMVNDHSMTSAALQQSAPTLTAFSNPFGMLDPRHAGMLAQLSATTGTTFDRLYSQMQLAGHREAVGLFATYASTGDDARLVSFARTSTHFSWIVSRDSRYG
ncbi:putative membrane protein [Bradyrhizobium sp. LM2.7]